MKTTLLRIIALTFVVLVSSSAFATELDADGVCEGEIISIPGDSIASSYRSGLSRALRVALGEAREECDGKRVRLVSSNAEYIRLAIRGREQFLVRVYATHCCGKVGLPK